MNPGQPYGHYDQGYQNLGCAVVRQIGAQNYVHFLLELDVSGMSRLRAASRSAEHTAPSYTAFVIKAAAQALHEHPHLNCMIQETPWATRLVSLPDVIGTVSVERMVDDVDMVLAARLNDLDQRPLWKITEDLRHFSEAPVDEIPEFREFCALAKLARWLPSLVAALLRLPTLSPHLWRKHRGGSFVVTSPGKYGGCDAVVGPWPWPLTFLFGAVKLRPWVDDGGQVVARKTMHLTIIADRRLSNGAPLARFAERVRELLEHPEILDPTMRTQPQDTDLSDSRSSETPVNSRTLERQPC